MNLKKRLIEILKSDKKILTELIKKEDDNYKQMYFEGRLAAYNEILNYLMGDNYEDNF